MKKTNIKIDFRIMGNNFDLSYMTGKLEISPSHTWNVGEKIRNTDKKRTYTEWTYSTNIEETLDIKEQARDLTAVFIPKTKLLCELKQELDLNFSVDIVVIIEDHTPPAICLENSIINFAATIGSRIDIDVYVN